MVCDELLFYLGSSLTFKDNAITGTFWSLHYKKTHSSYGSLPVGLSLKRYRSTFNEIIFYLYEEFCRCREETNFDDLVSLFSCNRIGNLKL